MTKDLEHAWPFVNIKHSEQQRVIDMARRMKIPPDVFVSKAVLLTLKQQEKFYEEVDDD